MTPAIPQEKTSPPEADAPPLAPTAEPVHVNHATDTSRSAEVGRWAYRHKDWFNGNVGWFTAKQVTGSFLASFNMMCTAIPTVFGLDWMKSRAAAKLAEGQGGAIARTLTDESVYKPLRAIAFVASGFTMYRGTRKVVNKLYERVFNPANDQNQTIEEVQHLPQHLKDTVREIMPAEAQSTPFGAIALGGIRSLYNAGAVPKAHQPLPGNKVRDVLMHRDSKFAQQAVIDVLGYSAFFELSDRLYKDVQLRRDKWKGQPNSIAPIKHSAMDDAAPPGDDDPTLKRLVFRRILPTAMGITAYTVTHRLSKMQTGAPAPVVYGEGASAMLKKFGHSFGAECAAIGTFFVHSAIAEKYEKAYDALLDRLNGKDKAKAPSAVAVG